MAENDIAIQVGVVLDTKNIGEQLANIKTDKNNSIKISANLEDAKKEVKKYKESLGKESNAAKLLIDILRGESDRKIKEYIDGIHEKYVKSPIKITLDVDTQATTANINKAVGEMQQQVQKAVDQAAKSVGNTATTNVGSGTSGIPGVDLTQLKNTISDLEEIEGITKRISTGIMTEGGFKPGSVVDEFRDLNGTLGETLKVYRQLNEEETKLAGQNMLDEVSRTYETNYKTVSDYISRLETEFNKLYSGAFEGKNPLEGLYAKEAESALNAYRTEIEQIKSSGEAVTVEQQARIQQLHDYAQKVIEDQKRQAAEVRAYYNDLNKEYRQSEKQRASDQQMYDKMLAQREQEFQKLADQMSKYEAGFNKLYSGAFEQKNPLTGEFADKALDALQEYQDKYMEISRNGSQMTAEQKREVEELGKAAALAIQEQQAAQDRYNKSVEEQKRVISNIQEELNKVGKIENQAFGGTNALTGDFRKKAEEEIEAVKQKFSEIKKTAEESFEGAANVSKEQLKKITADFAAEINALQKRQYPADKIAAVDVDTKKASVINELNEQEEKLKSLGQTSSEFADRLRQLREELSWLGKIDSDIDAWAKWRNEFNLLEQDIKKFESSVQGMGQKFASGLENNQLDQINDVVNKLNSLDEQYTGGGVERIKSDFQSLSEEYQKIIDQLQSKDLTDSQFKELSKQAEELDQKLKQLTKEAATFGNQGSFDKFTASTNTLKLNLERLEKQYAALIAKNPELAGKVEDLKQKLESLRPGEIPTITKDISNLGKEMANASGQTAGLRGALTDAFGGLGSYLARFTSSYYLISKTIQGIKKMVTAVKEVDTSLVELQKVTNLTGDSLTQFTDKAYQMGAQLGRTGKDVIDAATTFSRAGYDLNEATQLAQSALVMTNVGVDIPNMESAASDMISILKAFDIQAEESMDVIDKLYNVANKEPLDFGNITQMLVTAGGTLAQAGTSLEESMGLLTGAFATMRTPAVANG